MSKGYTAWISRKFQVNYSGFNRQQTTATFVHPAKRQTHGLHFSFSSSILATSAAVSMFRCEVWSALPDFNRRLSGKNAAAGTHLSCP
jgi:hypothetical protein